MLKIRWYVLMVLAVACVDSAGLERIVQKGGATEAKPLETLYLVAESGVSAGDLFERRGFFLKSQEAV